MSTKSPRYTPEFKQKLVKEVLEGGKSKTSVAREYGVALGSVKNWVKQYRENRDLRQAHRPGESMHNTSGTKLAMDSADDKTAREKELERKVQHLQEGVTILRQTVAYLASPPTVVQAYELIQGAHYGLELWALLALNPRLVISNAYSGARARTL